MSEAKPPPFEEAKPYDALRSAPYNNIGAWLRYLDKRVDELKVEGKKKETEEFNRRLRSQINGYNEIIWHCKSSELREQLEAARADCIKKLVNSYGGSGVMAEDYAHSGFALGAGAKPFTPPTHRTNEELRVEQEIKMGLMPSYIARRTTAEKLSVHGAPVQKPPPISEINAGGEVCAEVFKNIGAWLEHTDKRVDELQAMSNAHGAPVQDAKSKYLDDLCNIPGLEVKSRTGQQQTMGETTKQALNDLDYIKTCEYNQMQAKSATQTFAQQQIYQKQAQAAADYMNRPNPLLSILEKKDPPPMNHEPEFVPPKALRSRTPWYIAAYVLIGIGTFVQVQHYSEFDEGDHKNTMSVVGTAAWPVYWAGVGIYHVLQGVLLLDTYVSKYLSRPPKAPAKSCTDDKSGSWAPDAEGICHMPPPQTNGLLPGSTLNSVPSIITCTQVGQNYVCNGGAQ